ncbi:epoxide hydrolase family protein [Novosphingobium cyanobacteriorum]|uniref:Epoxide hydrolase n=1 Tax=Novosphingobium cyanobacteriorum TaxID=3024215 RepID=A0ABT6CKY4_9SPHN|nr:epoxide hydrolase family protein [Novosphingobium cyanobacteriorum]MDF8334580.1 epoxide hydrolase [Novosphingobium cyanobacteriorum]
MPATPFAISLPEQRLQSIRDRIVGFDWDAFPDAGNWSAGIAKAEMRRIADYWVHDYDWRAAEALLNTQPHFMAVVEGIGIHFLHVKGSAPGRRPPLLLIHGWPGSFLEFERCIERLAHPERFGGNAEDGFDLVIPSLPGFGLSGRPAAPIGPRAIARLFNRLMTEVLGYSHYVSQGGDWGSVIASWIAHDQSEACVALHLNMCLLQNTKATPETEEQKAYLAHVNLMRMIEGGYAHQQGTRPQTLGFALADSPVGAAAWILEKFAAWSDLDRNGSEPRLESVYTLDQLLTNIMLYVGTGNIVTSTWIYKAVGEEGAPGLEHRVTVPTGVAAFPDPVFPPPPRSYAEQSFAVTRWTQMAKGGHFAAMEQPEAFADDLRAFVLSLG